MRMETRKRLSRGSSDVQVSQSQAMEGTPVDVPVPRKVSFMIESNVQRPKSKVKSRTFPTLDFGLWTLDFELLLSPGYILTRKTPGLWRRVTQGDELHSQISE